MKIKFNDFRKGINQKNSDNLVSLDEAKMCYNFDFSGGGLKTDFPFEAKFGGKLGSFALFEEFIDNENGDGRGTVFYFKKYDFEEGKDASKLIVVTPNLAVYYLNLGDKNASFVPLDITFTSVPLAINYRLDSEDVVIFSSATDNMVVWDGVNLPEVVIDAPKITSMCLHSERLFATTEGGSNEVWFSDDLDPTNWSVSLVDAGFIQLADERGAPKKVVSYNGYVYIFRDKGISRLSASGAQEEFYLSHLFVSSGKIFDKTIALCGDRVIFLASDGLYSFNGTETTKILEDVSSLILPTSTSTAVYFDGKYYLSSHIDFGDENFDDSDLSNNALFVFDTFTNSYVIYRGLSVTSMSIIEDGEKHELLLVNSTAEKSEAVLLKVDKGYRNSPSSKYITGLYDFGEPSKKKTVRKITTYKNGEGNISISVFNEKNEAVEVSSSEEFTSRNVLLSGYALGFSVCGSGDATLQNLVLEVF